MTSRGLTILFSGMLAGDPWQGGATWAVLQYVLGLRRLGHEVVVVEPVGEEKLRPRGTAMAQTEQARYFREVTGAFGLEASAALLRRGTKETVGMAYEDLRAVARRADLLINVSGMLDDPALLEPIGRRVYLDLDPAFVQLWHAVEGVDMRFAAHTHFATVGMNIGRPGCAVPTCGVEWVRTPQPVVLEQWPVGKEIERDAWTTVGNWRGYGSVTHEGVRYGQKAHSMRELIDLPGRTRERLEMALAIHGEEKADLAALAAHGWRLADPAEVAGTPEQYARFVRGSKGELGVAKSGYVASNCGWFSDRSACYLASGRPVVAQETGWSEWLGAGEGVLSFKIVGEAAAAMEAVGRDYARHGRAARAVAERYFESDQVLTALLGKVGAGEPTGGWGRADAGTEGGRADGLRCMVDAWSVERFQGNVRVLVGLRRSAGEYASSFGIEDVELEFDDGTVARMVLKDLGPRSLLPEAARVKPAFLYDPRREIETYRNILGPYEVGAPKMVGAAVDEAAESYLILLEKAGGVPLWQIGDIEAWCAAARRQAAMHVRLSRDAAALASRARLLRYDEEYFARWYDRAESALDSSANIAETRYLLRTYETAIPRLLRLPQTFIHGEFHASNVLVEQTPGGMIITPVDWEMAALGPGLMDLADLTAGNWTPAQRATIAGAYRDTLAESGAPASPDFARELDDCRLHRAMQWLGWSAGWSPPCEHAQDWFAEALRVCRCLDESAST